MMGAQTEHKKSGEGGCEERRGQVEKGSKIWREWKIKAKSQSACFWTYTSYVRKSYKGENKQRSRKCLFFSKKKLVLMETSEGKPFRDEGLQETRNKRLHSEVLLCVK
jgi:hypothetical protein